MATSAKKNSKDSFDEKFFKFIFNNRFDPDNVEFEGTYTPYDFDLYKGLENVKEYDEFKNALINRLEKAGNYDMLQKPMEAYNDLYGDIDKGNEGVFDMTKLSPIQDLLKSKRELGYDNLPPEDVMKMMDLFREATGISVGNGMSGKNEWGYSSDSDKKAFAKMLSERLHDPQARRLLYSDLGYVMPEKGDDQYLIDDLYNLTRRGEMIKRFNDVGEGAKIAGEFLSPYAMDAYEEGKAPTYEWLLDLATFAPAGAGAVAKKVPSFITKIPGLQKLAGAELDNALSKLGLGGITGAGFDVADNILDSLTTKHVYSNVPGEEDSERGDALAALLDTKALAKAAGGAALAIGGSRHAKHSLAAQKASYKTNTADKVKELEAKKASYHDPDNPLNVGDEEFMGANKELQEIADNAPKKEDPSNFAKLLYFAAIKGLTGNMATQMLFNAIGPLMRK